MPRERVGQGTQEQPEQTEDEAHPSSAPVRFKQIVVTWGEEVLQPLQYHTMRLGPFSAVVELAPGDDPKQKAREAWVVLDGIAREEFSRKLAGYLGRIRETAAETSKQKGNR